MICHCIGNEEDNIKGRQMPVHYSYREGRFISVRVRSGLSSVRQLEWR